MARKYRSSKKVDEPAEKVNVTESIIETEIMKEALDNIIINEAVEVEVVVENVDEIEGEEKITVSVKEEDVKSLKEDFDVDIKEEIKEMVGGEVEVKIIPQKQNINLNGLSRSQLRIYQRTGRLPK